MAPCLNVTCDVAPAPLCVNTSTRRVYGLGTCHNSMCDFVQTDVTCPNGCASGECVGACSDEVTQLTPAMESPQSSAITTDSGGVHVVLFSHFPAVGTYAHLAPGQSWHSEPIPGALPGYVNDVDIVVDALGTVHTTLAAEQDIAHLRRAPLGGWTTQFVDSQDALAWMVASNLFVASDGSMHLLYSHGGQTAVRHGHFVNDGWVTNQIATYSAPPGKQLTAGEHLSITGDSQGTLSGFNSIVHSAAPPSTELRENPSDGGWSYADDWPGAGQVHASVDADDTLHVIRSSGASYRYYRRTASSTAFTFIEELSFNGRMSVDAVGNLFVLTTSALHRRTPAGVWTSDAAPAPVFFVDFTLDAADVVHVLASDTQGQRYHYKFCP